MTTPQQKLTHTHRHLVPFDACTSSFEFTDNTIRNILTVFGHTCIYLTNQCSVEPDQILGAIRSYLQGQHCLRFYHAVIYSMVEPQTVLTLKIL